MSILLALRGMPLGSLARRALLLPTHLVAIPDDLDGLRPPWELPPVPGLRPAGPAGATWMPVVGSQAWEESPDVHSDPDLLRRWSRGRLREVLHAATLARTERDGAAAVFAVARVTSFLRDCPEFKCDHWSSGMEIGLRAMRLLHAAARLAQARDGGLAVPNLAPFARALELHEHALESRVDWRLHRTGNHHLVALAARIVLAAHLPAHDVRTRRLARDARAFGAELLRQAPDGMHFESSTHYHLLVAEAAAHAERAMQLRGVACDPAPRDVLAGSLAALLRPDGSLPSVGDSDDESFVPACVGPDPPPVLRALEVARALGDEPRSPDAGNGWSGGGLHVLSREGSQGGPLLHVTVSATGPGRSGTGGHSHDDATACEIWLDGPVLGHRGTGAYAADRPLRETLRSVQSHAAVQVDAREMNDALPAHAFRRRHRAHPFTCDLPAEPGAWDLAVGHHGFAIPAPGAAVLRSFRLRGDEGLVIEDRVTGAGVHALTLRLPWAPGIEPETPRSTETPSGGLEFGFRRRGELLGTCRMSARGPQGALLELLVEHVSVRHWPRQGESVPAWTTELRLRSGLPVTIRHDLRPAAWDRRDPA